MTNIAVIYYSSTGSTYKLAEAAAAAAEKEGAEVRLLRVAEIDPNGEAARRDGASDFQNATKDVPVVTLADLEWADGILIGTPVHFGLAAPQLMHFINSTSKLSIEGKLLNKAVSAFASGSAAHGGQVSAILALHNAITHWGSLIVSTGSTDPVLYKPKNGNPYGASAVVGGNPGQVPEENLEAAAFQARRTLEVAAVVKTLDAR
ncbi:NAD(P)H dehydrogenase (quinone) [Streptomyces sp. 2132.2]|uniref:NAD(P)H dehydrogenase n=1 Tax=Streptomyces vinaceus TaxID=1960 RepID=A0A5J6JF91_STRVI|nr:MULTISPECIES: NAD(P)H-dependent oxidoreductase [Streptomyces]QEV46198.1 NAD(P)H dehydrogenase [Streptomyces vinaceus]ROQ96589.1 NAD(P)H dehydrogenase (quinone) [Streptomyces sp. 2132.2]GHE75663.1 TrpR-binding protein WrbA [Streptomyces vinaceus]